MNYQDHLDSIVDHSNCQICLNMPFEDHAEAFEALYFTIEDLVGHRRASDNRDVIWEIARHIANEAECRVEAKAFVRDLDEVENGNQ